jgi:hypothetical protein
MNEIRDKLLKQMKKEARYNFIHHPIYFIQGWLKYRQVWRGEWSIQFKIKRFIKKLI